MRRDEVMNILRTLARDGFGASFAPGFTDTIRKDWPDSFADILPAPLDLIGQRPFVPVRDAHVKGLQQAIEEQQSPGSATTPAKLRYHARWLLYLGDPEHESSPKVSIIIPIYNRGWLVDSLIRTCLDQSYSNIEIIVVDDGSSDETATRLAAFGNQIRMIRQPNAGVSAARNAGVSAATGEFVHFLDSDNLLHAEHLEAKVRAFAAIPDADVCFCSQLDVLLFGVKPPLRQKSIHTFWEEDTLPTVDLLDHILAGGFPFAVSAVTMPRHTFFQYGLFDADLRRCEDTRYWFHLALARPKVIRLARRLVYSCRMMDGLHETRYLDKSSGIVVWLRNAIDLLRKPERWPAAAEYLSAAKNWRRLLRSEGGAYERDFHILLQTIADLPRAGHERSRSPLPLLVFLWSLSERARAPKGMVRWGQAAP